MTNANPEGTLMSMTKSSSVMVLYTFSSLAATISHSPFGQPASTYDAASVAQCFRDGSIASCHLASPHSGSLTCCQQ